MYYISLVELEIRPEEGVDRRETIAGKKRNTITWCSAPIRRLIAAGKMSLTYPPIPSTFIFESCSIEELELEKPNKRTNKKKTILSTYFSSYQHLPWRWRPHLKAPFPLWLQHLGKRLSRKLRTGKLEIRKLGMQFASGWSPRHIFSVTHMAKHICNL